MGNKRPAPMRSRTTRSSNARLLSDPTQHTQLLNDQLRSLGLYAVNTLGDGNCLFRALSDQLFGTPSYHLKLRLDICDWIDSHKQRYEPFVEDERGLDVHLRCMRQQGTYGGHLELSAFAHLSRRDVKVIQPGLVYLIEWAAGWDPSQPVAASVAASVDDSQLDDREKRRIRRERRRSEQDRLLAMDDSPQKPVYVAYYDWEHFDSIRNLKGPHTGIPNVIEKSDDSTQPSPPRKSTRKQDSISHSKSSARKSSGAVPKLAKIVATPPTPSQVPLPTSRSPSPASLSDPSSSNIPYPALPNLLDTRVHRSPKRTFDESSASSLSETSESVSKKPRSSNPSPSRLTHETPQEDDADSEMEVDAAVTGLDADTPGLSPSGFSSESSLSPLSSPSPSAASPVPEVRLTRRQRKAMGLPKLRSHVAGTKGRGSGKIVIPGGKFKKGSAAASIAKKAIKVEPDDEAEWTKNGTGRVDVRGFRELKI